jgi:exosortase/archaeosortase family protein
MLLFLKRMPISLKAKAGYFVFGAAVTYVINAFRIVNIFLAGMTYGVHSAEVENIHLYYGPLYAVFWIVFYPLLILGTQAVWHKIRKPKAKLELTRGQTQFALNPA